MPSRSWLKNNGPGSSARMANHTRPNTGSEHAKPTTATVTSIALLKPELTSSLGVGPNDTMGTPLNSVMRPRTPHSPLAKGVINDTTRPFSISAWATGAISAMSAAAPTRNTSSTGWSVSTWSRSSSVPSTGTSSVSAEMILRLSSTPTRL